MATLPRQADTKPAQTPDDCRHSKAAFHCSFAVIAERGDLSDSAKLFHAGLVSAARRGVRMTQTMFAELLGWKSRQKVWRAACELVAAGLLRVKRLGLGRPNEYTLVPTEDVTSEDLKARAPRTPGGKAGHQEDRPRNAPAHARTFPPKKTDDGRKDYDTKGGRSGRAAQDSGSGEVYRTQDGVPLTEAQRECFAPLGSRPSQGAAETFEDWQERAQREYWAQPENRPSQGAAETYVELQERRQREHQARPENRPSQRPASKDYLETRAPGGTDYLETRYGRLELRRPCDHCYSTLHRTEEHESTRAR